MALFAAAVIRVGWVGSVWHQSQNDLAAVIRAMSNVERNTKILIADFLSTAEHLTQVPTYRTSSGLQPLYWHVPVLIAVRNDAFVPTLFATPGKQPLRVRHPVNLLVSNDAVPTTILNLMVPEELLRSYIDNNNQMYFWRYLRNWRSDFDYVLLLNTDRAVRNARSISIPNAELVSDEGYAQLWRIIRAGLPS